jgi:putative hydrolase
MMNEKFMKNYIDMHVHTVASEHAYSTVLENIQYAKQNGIKVIGLADHGTKMLDGPNEYFFANLDILPKYIDGVRLLKGIELNILDENGLIDLQDTLLCKLDFAIASMHPGISPYYFSKEQNTNAFLSALDNEHVKIIGHLGNPNVPVDYKVIVEKAAVKNKLIELNNSSGRIRPGSFSNCCAIAKHAKKVGCKLIFNSDAHFALDVGNIAWSQKIMEEADLSEDHYVNHSPELLYSILGVEGDE